MSRYAGLEDWRPSNIEDWIANYDYAQQQLAGWQQQYQAEAVEAEAVDQYALDPAEAARRREEAYRESRYAAQERYGEQPRYQEIFGGWLPQAAEQMSGALLKYTRGQYPSLRTEYQAGQPRLTGYPTREEARAEATRREAGWQAWLPQRVPKLEQEYWAQRPAERGERLYMQAPVMRAVNW